MASYTRQQEVGACKVALSLSLELSRACTNQSVKYKRCVCVVVCLPVGIGKGGNGKVSIQFTGRALFLFTPVNTFDNACAPKAKRGVKYASFSTRYLRSVT